MNSKEKEAESRLALLHFIEHGNPKRISKHLRNILLDYIEGQKNCLPLDFDVYLSDMRLLFDFFDAIHE